MSYTKDISFETYRAGVGMVLIQPRHGVFVGQRLQHIPGDSKAYPWQWPQGGIEDNETPEDALFREMEEEIGTRDFRILGRTDWILYTFPETIQHLIYDGRFKGQRHIWFATQLLHHAQINIQTTHPEFSEWCWMPPQKVVSQAVPFKRDAYIQVYNAFKPLFFDVP